MHIGKLIMLLGSFLLPSLSLAGTMHVVAPAIQLDVRTDKVAFVVGLIDKTAEQKFAIDMDSTSGIPGDRLIIINSIGGSLDSGKEMVKKIEAERATGVRTVCLVTQGAHSMAFNLLTHCDVRLAVEGSTMLVHKVHRPIISAELEHHRLTAAYLRKIANELDLDDKDCTEANRKAMGLSAAEYDTLAANETTWTAEVLLKRHYLHALGKIVR